MTPAVLFVGLGGVNITRNLLVNLSSAALYLHCGSNIRASDNVAALLNTRDFGQGMSAVQAGSPPPPPSRCLLSTLIALPLERQGGHGPRENGAPSLSRPGTLYTAPTLRLQPSTPVPHTRHRPCLSARLSRYAGL